MRLLGLSPLGVPSLQMVVRGEEKRQKQDKDLLKLPSSRFPTEPR